MLVEFLDVSACRIERADKFIRLGSGLFIGTRTDTTGCGQDGSDKQAGLNPRRDARR